VLSLVGFLPGYNASEETYKVIALTKSKPVTDMAVLIDNKTVYRMQQVAPGSILYQVKAPKATIGYKYVHINRANNQTDESEPFDRPPKGNAEVDDEDNQDNQDNEEDDLNSDKKKKKKDKNKKHELDGVLDGMNEFYGRAWTLKNVKTFDPIDAFPQAYDRSPAPDLHPQNEIPTMHVQAPQSDIDKLHGYYLQDLDYKANITYIT
jgi:hypothetical protein